MVKSKVISQFNYPLKVSKTSNFRLAFFPILNNKFIDLKFRSIIYSSMLRKSRAFPSRYKVSCFLTGRGRGILTSFHISRLTFKQYAMGGQLTGFFKSRW